MRTIGGKFFCSRAGQDRHRAALIDAGQPAGTGAGHGVAVVCIAVHETAVATRIYAQLAKYFHQQHRICIYGLQYADRGSIRISGE